MANASLVLNTDSHSPQDLVSKELALRIAIGAGMTDKEASEMFRNSDMIVKKALAC
jgi:histidinol phosphatase-like PHP family hydrolase